MLYTMYYTHYTPKTMLREHRTAHYTPETMLNEHRTAQVARQSIEAAGKAREVESRRGGSGRRRSGAGECRAASQTLRHENADEAEEAQF